MFNQFNQTFLAWLEFQPHIALSSWIALAVLMAVTWLVYVYYSRKKIRGTRRNWILVFMFAVGISPLFLLLNPTWVEPTAPPDGQPLVTVLVDVSDSMNTKHDGKKRVEAARELATDLESAFGPAYEYRILKFDSEAAGVGKADEIQTAPGNVRSTDLANAIDAAVKSDRPRGQAVIMLSDGIHNVGSVNRVAKSAANARGLAAPIFPVQIGEQIDVQNLSITSEAANRIAFVDQPFELTASLSQQGFTGATATLKWSGPGLDEEAANSEYDLIDGKVDVRQSTKITEPGLYRYSVEGEIDSPEATKEDNGASILVRVLDRPIGVLLIEGKPYWDSKFLARNLAADQSVLLDSLVMMRPDRILHRRQIIAESAESSDEDSEPQRSWQIIEQASGLLGSLESLKQYQVIVLGRDSESFLDAATVERLREWVAQEGGSLVCSRGAPQSTLSQRLGRMLPVRWSAASEKRFRAKSTDIAVEEGWLPGNSNPVDPLSALPSLVTNATVEKRGGLPRVLVTGENGVPLLTYQPYGSGRTVVVEGAGMWRWALLPPEYADNDEIYSRVWNGLLHWLVSRVALAPGQQRALQSDRDVFRADTPASATVLVRDSASNSSIPKVRLMAGDNMIKEVIGEPLGDQPGVFRVGFGLLPTGSYRAELVDAEITDRSVTAFDVRNPISERLQLSPRIDVIDLIARQSGGEVLNADTLEGISAEKIASVVDRKITASMPIETENNPAWDRWWVLSGLLCVWACAWVLRRSNGLV